MEKTIKGIEVIAYKGMKSNMTCRNFQYEVGKSYKTDKVERYNCGFHACLNPQDVLNYYLEEGSRYYKVKLSGEITKCGFEDTNVAATEITILEEITDIFDEIIETTEWWKNDNILDLLYYIEGFASVQRGDELWNFIDKKGNILSNEWFNDVYSFYEGFARVQRANGEWNFIDKYVNYLSDEWFNYCCSFTNGLAAVQRKEDKLWNFIDKNGNYLSDEWFNVVNAFDGDFAEVQRTNGEWCKIDKTGKLIKLQ